MERIPGIRKFHQRFFGVNFGENQKESQYFLYSFIFQIFINSVAFLQTMLLRDTGNPPCAELSINLFNIYFLLSSGSNLLALYCEGFFKYTKNERFENICWRAEGYKYYIICIPFFLVFCFFPWSFLFGIWGVFKSI